MVELRAELKVVLMVLQWAGQLEKREVAQTATTRVV